MRTLTTAVLLLTATVVAADDSPLVALAKRSHRNAPASAIVITNETLAKSGGRLSVASGEARPINLPPAADVAPAANATPANKPAAAAAPVAPAVDLDNYPVSSARKIEPQITARTIDAQSTARTIDPVVAPIAPPPMTVQVYEPQGSARVIEPQVVPPPK
ncbi:MAG TPA: hypothetical protein VFN10_21990 [Thermoanaerobaculia bacterium]|nr:hypothetical protein [Thermoanaerobaculia bacterium]